MSSNSSGKRLEGFFTGKGFYIVLFLCAAVIGVRMDDGGRRCGYEERSPGKKQCQHGEQAG